jgi:isocitrate dehydrogenase
MLARNAIRRALINRSRISCLSTDKNIGAYKHNYEDIVGERAALAKKELSILAQAFMRFDGDGNGQLDRTELLKALSDLQLPANDVDVDTLFRALDVDNDGAIKLTEWLDHLPRGTRAKINYARAFSTSAASDNGSIIYTYTDEAPMLATYSLLPIVRAFTNTADVNVELKDISVAGRILCHFPDYLEPSQRIGDHLAELGELAKTPRANIIKLPNVSAAMPQLTEAIEELRSQGFMVPLYPANPTTDEDHDVIDRYSKVLGSSVNPVLREGNSDRRVAAPVKAHAAANPHKLKPWNQPSRTHVAHMSHGDFFENEKSVTMSEPTTVRIEHVAKNGDVTVLKAETTLQAGEMIDATKMDVAALCAYFEENMSTTRDLGDDVLLSLHLKATMMKVSDPIMFGHAVKVYFKDVFAKHGALFDQLGVLPNNGLSDVYLKIQGHPQQAEIEADIMEVYKTRPPLAMVDSGRGITNLHAPNDVIIDASVPPVIRDGGMMWNWGDELADTRMLIPDRCYATMYSAIVEDCKVNGNFDVSTMGNVSNVGLMAQKAQEYGSHDKTFEQTVDGVVRVVNAADGSMIFEHEVSKGDIWRMCQTKDAPIQDWVKLAVSRAKATGNPAVFWLDETRAHDAALIKTVNKALAGMDTDGVETHIMAPAEAMKFTLARVRNGQDNISVTGNVLRDYLTDLFPILELGTSAKMLSIVPLLAGGGLFETGAGGSAPKHVQQLVKENHLRWDSLGEFLALAVSLEDLATKTDNTKAKAIGDALNVAVGRVLSENRSPQRKVNTIDNRGSHYYLALFWAEALAAEGGALGSEFEGLAKELRDNEEVIMEELNSVQGVAVDLGGYYNPDAKKAEAAMRPSPILNKIIDARLAAGGSFVA